MSRLAAFSPEWISPPGDSIDAILRRRRMTADQFAAAIGATNTEVQRLLSGEAEIESRLAKSIASAIGPSDSFWLKREENYRQSLAATHRQFDALTSWEQSLPTKDMVDFGWLRGFGPSNDISTACLRFFGINNLKTWSDYYDETLRTIRFRASQSFASKPESVVAWLRQGELQSGAVKCDSWNPDLFSRLLARIRTLSRIRNPAIFFPQLTEVCSTAGVAVVVVRAPDGCRASGAARFITPKRAIIQLSMRHLSDDHFWFSFFHESAHLLLHSNDGLFVDTDDEMSTRASAKEESEANAFAALTLVPEEYRERLLNLKPEARQIARFAKELNVSAGIIVGQLQHAGIIKYSHFNPLKTYYEW